MRATLRDSNHIIHSSAYKDQERQQLCRTYGISLDAEHLLLVDVSEDDLLSYIRNV